MPARVRALIIDDEPDMCWALEKILEPEGYNILVTTTAKDAFTILQRDPFDLVFIDAKLPDAEGTDLCSQIKSIGEKTDIFLMSGYFFRDDAAVQDLIKRGLIADFLGKPFDAAHVRTQARRAVERMGCKDPRNAGPKKGKEDLK